MHRVVSVSTKGIRTRGDNSKKNDSYIVPYDNVLGKVVYAQRGKKQLYIYNGFKGILSILILL